MRRQTEMPKCRSPSLSNSKSKVRWVRRRRRGAVLPWVCTLPKTSSLRSAAGARRAWEPVVKLRLLHNYLFAWACRVHSSISLSVTDLLWASASWHGRAQLSSHVINGSYISVWRALRFSCGSDGGDSGLSSSSDTLTLCDSAGKWHIVYYKWWFCCVADTEMCGLNSSGLTIFITHSFNNLSDTFCPSLPQLMVVVSQMHDTSSTQACHMWAIFVGDQEVGKSPCAHF